MTRSATRLIVEQTARIANMTRRINDFASAGRDTPEVLDINQLVQSVCDFLYFDRRFHGTPIDLRLRPGLPACSGVPDHLTEVLMGLLQAFEQGCQSCGSSGSRLAVETGQREGEIMVRINGTCESGHAGCALPVGDPRLESARGRIEAMAGRIVPAGSAVEIWLPCAEISA